MNDENAINLSILDFKLDPAVSGEVVTVYKSIHTGF